MKLGALALIASAPLVLSTSAFGLPPSAHPVGSASAHATTTPSSSASTPSTATAAPSTAASSNAPTVTPSANTAKANDAIACLEYGATAGYAHGAEQTWVKNNRITKYPDCVADAQTMCADAARGKLDADSTAVLLKNRRACLHGHAGLTAAPALAAVGGEIVRSIAQVVVTRAQNAGWGLIKQTIEDAAHCPKPDDKNPPTTNFPQSCKVLATLSIKDLVSSPEVLLQAVVTDLLSQVQDPEAKKVIDASLGVGAIALYELSGRWPQAGSSSIVDAMRAAIKKKIDETATTECSKTKAVSEKFLVVAGMCLVEYPDTASIDKCDVGKWIDSCQGDETDDSYKPKRDAEKRLWDLAVKVLQKDAKPKPIDFVNFVFALAQTAVDDLDPNNPNKALAQKFVAGGKDTVSGIALQDWVMATTGAVELVDAVDASLGPDPDTCSETGTDAAACKAAKAADADACKSAGSASKAVPVDVAKACSAAAKRTLLRDGKKAFALLAAIGNYALTFSDVNQKDPSAAAAAREKIINELVDRMVNRTERTRGVVVSLGGALGLFGGARMASTDKIHADFAFPVQLTLGVGLQTYGSGTGGFHAMASFIDLGQYVNWDAGDLKVGTPAVESALSFGLTLGGWCLLREMPIYIGVHGAIAPFNQASGNPTFQVGAVMGIYVPLLDFN